MKTIYDYLSVALQKAGSHALLGKAIGVSQQQATRCMNQQQTPSTAAARKLAQYIGEKETVVVMAAEAARARTKDERRFWEKLGEQLATTAVIILSANVVAMTTISGGDQPPEPTHSAGSVYIMSNSRRRFSSRCNALIRAPWILDLLAIRRNQIKVLCGCVRNHLHDCRNLFFPPVFIVKD